MVISSAGQDKISAEGSEGNVFHCMCFPSQANSTLPGKVGHTKGCIKRWVQLYSHASWFFVCVCAGFFFNVFIKLHSSSIS